MNKILKLSFLTFSFLAMTITVFAQEAKVAVKPKPAPKLAVGEVAPDFKLKNVDDTYVSMSEMENAKGFIVVFTCNHCPYAVMYEDRLVDLHNTYAPKGYPVIAINPNDPEVVPSDSFAEMKIRAEEKKFPFVYLMDEGQKVYPQYGARKTPHVFVLNKERVVTYIGAVDDNYEDATAVKEKYVENAIAAMDKGVAVDPSMTKAIGCSIKTTKNPPRKKKKKN